MREHTEATAVQGGTKKDIQNNTTISAGQISAQVTTLFVGSPVVTAGDPPSEKPKGW